MSWSEKLIELDRIVKRLITSPYDMMSLGILDIQATLKDNEEAAKKFKEMVEKSLEAAAMYAEGTMQKENAEIVLKRYKKSLENYADAAKIKAANKAANEFEALFMRVLNFIGMLMKK